MKKQISKYSFLFSWASFASKAGGFLVVIPLMLNKLSPNDMSFWYLFNNIIWIVALLDAGYLSTLSRFFGYSNREKKQGVICSDDLELSISHISNNKLWEVCKLLYRQIALIVLVFLITIGTLLIFNSINVTSNSINSWLVWCLGIVLIPIITFCNSFLSFLIGTNRIVEIRMWEILFNCFNIIFAILILLFYPSISLLILNLLFWLTVGCIRNYYLFKKHFLAVVNLNKKSEEMITVRKEILEQGGKSMIGVIFSAGIFQLVGFYYSWKINTIELSSYLFAFNLIWSIRNFSQAPFYDKLPQMTLLTANNKIEELQVLARKYMVMTYAAYSFFFFIILFFQKNILHFIKSKITAIDSNLWILLGTGFILERYGAMHLQVYTSSNKIISHKANVVSGILLIVFVALLIKPFGVLSFPISLIISYLLFYIWYSAKKSYKLLNTTFLKFEIVVFLPFILLFILTFIYINYFNSL